jgi:hypothetical protein
MAHKEGTSRSVERREFDVSRRACCGGVLCAGNERRQHGCGGCDDEEKLTETGGVLDGVEYGSPSH